jgi:hypothetical protein
LRVAPLRFRTAPVILRQKATSPWGFRAVVEDFAGHRVELIEKEKLPTECVEEFQRVHIASR